MVTLDQIKTSHIKNRPFYRDKGTVKKIDRSFIPEEYENSVEIFDFDDYEPSTEGLYLSGTHLDESWAVDFVSLIKQGKGVLLRGTCKPAEGKVYGHILDIMYHGDGSLDHLRCSLGRWYMRISASGLVDRQHEDRTHDMNNTANAGSFAYVGSGARTEFKPLANNASVGQLLQVSEVVGGHPVQFSAQSVIDTLAATAKLNFSGPTERWQPLPEYAIAYAGCEVLLNRIGDYVDCSKVPLPVYTYKEYNNLGTHIRTVTERFVLGKTLLADSHGWHSSFSFETGHPMFYVTRDYQAVPGIPTTQGRMSPGVWVAFPVDPEEYTKESNTSGYRQMFTGIASNNDDHALMVQGGEARWMSIQDLEKSYQPLYGKESTGDFSGISSMVNLKALQIAIANTTGTPFSMHLSYYLDPGGSREWIASVPGSGRIEFDAYFQNGSLMEKPFSTGNYTRLMGYSGSRITGFSLNTNDGSNIPAGVRIWVYGIKM